MNLKEKMYGRSHNLLAFHLLFSGISGSFILILILKNFSGQKNLLQTNFSLEKIIFLLLFFLLVLVFYVSAFYFLLRTDKAKEASSAIFESQTTKITALRISGVGFLLCWMGYFFSPHLVFEGILGYFLLIKPLLLWGGLFFVSIIAVIHLGTREENVTLTPLSYRVPIIPSFIVLFFCLLFFLFVKVTGMGVSIREDYWYGAGVPVLWIQIVCSLFLGVAFLWIFQSVQVVKRIIKIDMVVFLMLWLVAAYFWGKEPLQSSHFMPDTGANQIFPYSDAATFDAGSQYALIGQGLFNNQYFDRSLYSALLTYFHTVAGQDTENLMVIQAALFAVFPAILFLIGKELHGRSLGVALSALVTFRGLNAIFGSSMIDSAGPKMMLTDFPTAIGISLIILFILKWMRNPQKTPYMIWAGCSIGMTLLLRTHVIFLLPFIFVFVMIVFKNRKIFWIYGIVFLILGMLVSTMPLDVQNQKKDVPVFYMYYSRIQLMLKERYGFSDDSGSAIPQKSNTALLIGRERVVGHHANERPACATKYCAVVNHFFHNLTTSVLSLPTSLAWDDFRHTVKEATPYWKQDWTGGGLGFENYTLLFVNLTFIASGIGLAWEKTRYGALLPLMIYFVYMLSNSLAFTSGGRYIVPVDWILYIYYLIGTLTFCLWLFRQTGFDFSPEREKLDSSVESFGSAPIVSVRLIGTFVAVFMIGSIVPLADSLFPQRYHEKNTNDVLVILNEQELLQEANLTQVDVSEFLNTPDARLISGRLLYPRFYASDEGEYGLDYPYTPLDYRRLAFMVIGSLRPWADGVIFPVENSIPGLHASDVIVLGCANSNFLDAAVIFVLSEPKKTYIRSADLVLQCPLLER